MSRSITINCVGYAPAEKENKYRVFDAMSQKEIAQARAKAGKEGLKIKFWQSQTKVGERILNGKVEELDENIIVKKMVECPICLGKGYNGQDKKGIKYHCPVCDGSGITKKGDWNHWQSWQLEDMKKRNK